MARILHLIPYSVFPPIGGGALRVFGLLRELARHHEVHAIILQPLEELRAPHANHVFPVNVHIHTPDEPPPPNTAFHWLPPKIGKALHYRWLRRSLHGPANLVLLETYHLIEKVLRRCPIDIALLEHFESLLTAPVVRRLSQRTLRVFDDCNVESELFLQVAKETGITDYRREYQSLRWQESHIARYAEAFWACSEVDRHKLEEMNRGEVRGFTIPNAVDVPSLPYDARPDKARSKEVLFCATLGTPANRNGLIWFHEGIWPRILAAEPSARLLVVGQGAKPEDFRTIRADSSVDWIGEVDSVVPFYRRAGVAVTPLLQGSGTRLKILEALSLGNPMVSTRIGAEGLELVPEKHLLIADTPEAFANSVLRLLVSPESFELLRYAGRTIVEEKYCWAAVGRLANASIEQLLQTRKDNNRHVH